jgi:hypothetical protein
MQLHTDGVGCYQFSSLCRLLGVREHFSSYTPMLLTKKWVEAETLQKAHWQRLRISCDGFTNDGNSTSELAG